MSSESGKEEPSEEEAELYLNLGMAESETSNEEGVLARKEVELVDRPDVERGIRERKRIRLTKTHV